MPLSCSICIHERCDDMNTLLIEGKSVRHIASLFSVGYRSVHRHKMHLPEAAAKAIKVRQEDRGIHIMDEIQVSLSRIKKVSDSCDEFLSRPDDPSRYYMGPRAEDLEVVYDRGGSRREIRLLSEYLKEIDTSLGGSTIEVRYRGKDPRELILSAADGLQKYIEIASKIAHEMREKEADAAASREWGKVKAIIMTTLDQYPDAKDALMRALSQASL